MCMIAYEYENTNITKMDIISIRSVLGVCLE